MYQHFAPVYDTFMDTVPYGQWAGYLHSVFSLHHIGKEALVLDLACGTGTMASLMSQKGYEIIGVDASADMLSIAYEKNPAIMLLNQDMRSLDLYGTVDAAYSTCDAMNYLLTEEDFLVVLKNVALFVENIFVFDLKTENRYRQMGDKTYSDNTKRRTRSGKSGPSSSYIWKNYYDPSTRINEYQVQFFIEGNDKEGKNRKTFAETHRQRAYSIETVTSLAKEAGMDVVSITDNYTNNPALADSDRVVFSLKKSL